MAFGDIEFNKGDISPTAFENRLDFGRRIRTTGRRRDERARKPDVFKWQAEDVSVEEELAS